MRRTQAARIACAIVAACIYAACASGDGTASRPTGPSTVSAAAAHPAASDPRHALLVAIPLPGHVNPLVSQALELHRRGWRVTVASPNRMAKHIAASGHGAVAYMDLGDCAAIQELHDALERAADHENYMESAREMFHWSIHLHSCMYEQLAVQVPKLSPPATVIIADFATYAGFDIADALGIPLVINNPDLLNMLSPDDVAPFDFVPGVMTAASLRTVSGPDSAYGLLYRTVYPPLRVLIRWLGEQTAGRELRSEQSRVGLSPTPLFTRMAGRLILVNNAFGLEWPRPVPPNVVLVGPMLSKPWRHSLQEAREEFQAGLSDEDRAWLGWRTPEGRSLPVIWVSMGTIAPLNQRQVLELYVAFRSGVTEGKFRVLWKLDPSDHQFLPSDLPSPNLLRVTTWVSSQLGVLAHPATRVFLSHCGINSVHESVYLGTALLCIPILADQADMAARVSDAGVGTKLAKATFTASELGETLEGLLAPERRQQIERSLARARAAMHLAGGVERAVDYIEFAAQHGADALVPVDATHPWYVRHNWDAWLIHVILLYAFYRLLRCCCCTHRPGRECVEDRRKVRSKAGARHAEDATRRKED